MKILHINSELTWRGGEKQIVALIENADAEHIVMGKPGSEMQTWCRDNNVLFVEASLKGSTDLKSAIKIKNVCRAETIDIVHAHTSHGHTLAVYAYCLGNRCPIVLHRRVSQRIKKGKFAAWKYGHKAIKHIICVSLHIQELMQERMDFNGRISVIYSSITPSRLMTNVYNEPFSVRYNLPQSEYRILNTSALVPDKDLFTYLSVARRVVDAGLDAQFLIAGEGALKHELEDKIKEMRLEKHVFMLGFVNDVKDLQEHSDLFMLTSRSEGLGSSILEAFTSRLPVIATNTGGIPELIEHQKTGMLHNCEDIANLADSVRRVLEDSSLASKLTNNAYDLYLKRHQAQSMADQTMKVYQRIVQEGVDRRIV